MSDNPLHPSQNPKRDKSLQQLSQIYSKIQFLELPENEFSTEELHQLSLLAQYSIHPVFSSKEMHQFHLKLTEKYWSKFDQLKNANHCEIPEERSCIIQKDDNLHVNSNQTPEIDPKVTPIQQKEEIKTDLNIPQIEKQTEAIVPQVKQVRLQLKVAKTYNDIKEFSLQFDYEKVLENQSISPKIKLLNSWTPVPCKLLNLAPKKVVQTPCKIDSASYLESIKMGKNARKDSNNIEPSKTIILGKNESTEMKQMKHMLKVQAKTNFVEQKQKEESKLDDIQKKSIQLNYLLNVITKEFFEDFFGDILKIVRGNGKIIEILCEKVIEKVKGEHNFIEIYVELIKRLTKSSLTEGQHKNTGKFNQLQQFFVAYLQESFVKLISLQIEPSCSNFNEYKYQKEMMGMCKFIGKLIKQKILSKKIFKVCFWQIVYRYVEKVKQNPENDIVNECLIEAIVVIQDSMGSVELLKLMQKEKQAQQKESDEPMEITNFQEMMMALVDPSDQDHISRQQSYKKLIESIKVEEYPHILMGLLHIFSSKRMKLQFLIEHWQQKIELMKTTSPQNVDKMEEERTAKIQNSEKMIEDVVEAQEEDLFEIKKVIHEFVKEIKVQTDLLSSTNNKEPKTKKPHNPQLHRHQSIIKKFIGQSPSKNSVANEKIFKLLVIQFLTHFADCKHPQTIPLRIGYFIDFVQPLHLTQHFHSRLLQIICKEEIENLMIIECDYPFLVDGLCLILVELMGRVKVGREEVEKKMRASYDPEDDDMDEFCGKVVGHLEKVWEKENGVKHGDQEIFED